MRAIILLLTFAFTPAVALAQDTTVERARALARAGEFHQAADLYQLAVRQSAPEPGLLGEAVDALEACGRWREAIPHLDRLLLLAPLDARRHWQRGLYAAWEGDRDTGLRHLRRAVALRPDDATYLGSLGEVLSWRYDGRGEAADAFHQALALNPSERRSLVGTANLLAWTGRPSEALSKYDEILRADPQDHAALAGKGAALQQLGRHRETRLVLLRAQSVAPGDRGVLVGLARTELALGSPRTARRYLDSLPGAEGHDPEVTALRDSIRRALRGSIEVGSDLTDRGGQLDRRSAHLRLVMAPADPVRLSVTLAPTSFHDRSGASAGYVAGAGLAFRTRGIGLAGDLRRRDFGIANPNWDGGASLRLELATRITIEGGWRRTPVEETRGAALGTADGSTGPVHADLATASVQVQDFLGRLSGRASLLVGDYRGEGWSRNGHVGGTAEATIRLRASQPHLRVGYGFRGAQFDHDASSGPAEDGSSGAGYFSPRRYFLHQGVLQLSHRLAAAVSIELDARAGGEAVRARPGEVMSRRLAIVGYTRLAARVSGGMDLELRYLYVDALDAFRLHQVRVAVRQYF